MGEARTRSLNSAGARTPSLVPPEEWCRLDLLKPVPLSNGGGEGRTLVIYRPGCKLMTEVLDTQQLGVQIERFANGCCKALNGSGEPQEFAGADLSCVDGSDVAGIIATISAEADAVLLEDTGGDAVTAPLIYTLQRPINLTPQLDDSETLYQIAFEAKKMSEITEFLDAMNTTETRYFHTFMRTFGKPLQLRIPIMTDAIINALDALDYMVIRRQILPKFIASRNRWKKASSAVH